MAKQPHPHTKCLCEHTAYFHHPGCDKCGCRGFTKPGDGDDRPPASLILPVAGGWYSYVLVGPKDQP